MLSRYLRGMASPSSVAQLLEGLSDLEIREASIEALRSWRRGGGAKESQVSIHGPYANALLPLLAKRKGVTMDLPLLIKLANSLLEAASADELAGIVEFWTWFVRAGFAIPLSSTPNAFTITFLLTRYGRRFLDKREEDHPLLPSALERLRRRSPHLPKDVAALLNDSRQCLDAGLMRPALVLMGVAYEAAIEGVIKGLVSKQILQASAMNNAAFKRLQAVRTKIVVRIPGTTAKDLEKRGRMEAACEFADALRARRNDAAHTTPTYGFDDRAETEEFLISAMRHLPPLWAIGR